MKKVVVTGGSGFIGSWLIQELLRNDYQVTTIVHSAEHLLPEIRSECQVISKDISLLTEDDFECDTDYDAFVNLAWKGVSPEEKNEAQQQIDNITMSIKALEIANKLKCRQFIASGTVAEYALCDNVINVYGRQTPSDMYGAAKVAAHYFVEVRARQLAQPFIWMIIPSTFGGRRKGNNIISYTINTLLRGEKPSFGSLNQMWDFLYVEEVVRAIRLIIEKGHAGKTYGIGSGSYRPLRLYIERIRDLIDPSLPLGIGELKQMSQRTYSSCVDLYELQKDTGFIPEISFDEGMKRTIEWYRNQ